ncbi:MAG: efflux RND transporter periplasmic adaptor subunit [Candidatus Methylomirabilales bacterium]
MARNKCILAIIVIGLVIGGAVWYSASSLGQQQQEVAVPAQAKLIETRAPRRQDFHVVSRWFGRAESKEVVKIVALEAGRVVSVEAKDETPVKKGAPLFTLGGANVDSRRASMRANVKALRERVAFAEQIVSRRQKSVEERLASRDGLDEAKATLAQLGANLGAALQGLRSLQDAVHVRAPIVGVFTRRGVSVGQAVMKGTVLAEVVAPKLIRVVATLFTPGDAQLRGRAAVIHAADGGSLSGTVTKVLPERTPEGATRVWIEGDELDFHLNPGEAVNGEILLLVHKGALAVPLSALVYDEKEQAYVFLKGPDGYSRHAVQTGLVSDGWVEISSGLREGAEVVIQGAYELFYRDFRKVYKVAD